MTLYQYVNLPQDSKIAEAAGKSIKRLGPVKIKVTFQKSNMSGFSLVCKCEGGEKFENYEDNEKARNLNFKVRGLPRVLTNDSKKEAKFDYDLWLNAAGGNEYKLEATHKGKTVMSPVKIESRRMLFYQTLVMVEPRKGPVPTVSTSKMETEFKGNGDNKYYIELKKMADKSEVGFVKCYHDRNTTKVIKTVAKEYELEDLYPYAFGIAFVNYIATPKDHIINRDVTGLVGGLSDSSRSMIVPIDDYLWYLLDDDDDWVDMWFKDLRLVFTPSSAPSGEAVVPVPLTIRKEDVRPEGPKRKTYGGHKKLKISFSEHRIRTEILNKRGSWQLKGTIRVAKGYSAGVSFRGINLLLIATKAWWRDSDLSGVPNTIIHEVGHKIGMVAHGDVAVGDKILERMFSLNSKTSAKGWRQYDAEHARKMKLPNSHDKLYGENRGVNDKGHRGPHCEEGGPSYNAGTEEWSGSPGCVMFGATSIGNNKAPGAFCGKCAKLVRKLDLSGKALKIGGFKISMENYN